MRKQLFLSVLILLMALPLLSFKSVNKTRNKIAPGVALIVQSKSISDNSEVSKESVEADKEDSLIKPDDADVYYNLGVSLGNAGRYKEAREAYEQAIKIRPDYAEAYYNLGFAYDELGMYREAIEAYKHAIKIKPDDVDIHYNLGVSLGNAGRYKEAIDAYKQAISIMPDYAEAHYNQGFAYNELGMYKEAEVAYKQAVRIKPDYAEAHFSLAPVNIVNTDLKDEGAVSGENKNSEKDNPRADNKQSDTDIHKTLSDKDNKYIVQVGAFKNINNANELIEKLKADYQYAYIEKENNFNKVRIPGIKTKKEGNLVLRDINEKLKIKPFLLRAYKE